MKPFYWLKNRKRSAPELPYESPIWFGPRSNGECWVPPTARERKIRKMILEKAAENANRLGMDRRQFLASSMGMITAGWVINQVTACSSDLTPDGRRNGGGGRGDGGPSKGDSGSYCAPEHAMFDESCANAIVSGKEFIFDIQTHWFKKSDLNNFPAYQNAFPGLFNAATEDAYIDQIFCKSDTTMVCLTAWPGYTCTATRFTGCGLPLSNQHMVESRQKINELAGNSQRVLNHIQILPQDTGGIDTQLEIMEQYYCNGGLAAWKLYPGFKPGFKLDDANGEAVILKGLELGVNLFCVHKGLPIGNFFDVNTNYPDEIGKVAAKHKDANFIIYHSGICSGSEACAGTMEGPYDPNDTSKQMGVNALLRSLQDAGIGPGGNVFGEVGTAFNNIKGDPTQAAHFFGKLMKYLGEDNVCWGTDSIINGSPQSQIDVFRMLEIPKEMQDKYGYPPLDATRKAKILGLNSAKVYGVDVEARRCLVDQCPMTAMKRTLDEELGPRRHVFEAPNGPMTYEEWLEGAEEMKRTGRPG